MEVHSAGRPTFKGTHFPLPYIFSHPYKIAPLSFQNIHYICIKHKFHVIMKEDINLIKVVLAEKKRTNKWLAEHMGKDPATVSKWCTNSAQPGLETMVEMARLQDVEAVELLRSSRIIGK